MSKLILFVGVLALSISAVCVASEVRDNQRLSDIFEADQASRTRHPIDWEAMVKQDRERRAEVLDMIRNGSVRTALDYFNAALVFQHGETLEDYRLAFALAKISATLDPGFRGARGMMAA